MTPDRPLNRHKTLFLSAKSAGQARKRVLNVLFSMTSVSRSMGGTSLGQHRDTGQAGQAVGAALRELARFESRGVEVRFSREIHKDA